MEKIFTGKMKDFREFFSKRWCKSHNIDESKWMHVGLSLMNGVRVKNIESGNEYKMTAGLSGCNFMMVDKTGGHHSFLHLDDNDYEFFERT